MLEMAEYILEHEADDFEDWVYGDGEDILTRETFNVLDAWYEARTTDRKKLEKAFKEASRYHIYATARLCIDE